MALTCYNSAQLVRLKGLIAYKTRHGVIWLGREDQEVRLGYKGLGCKCEGQARGSGAIYCQGGEA